MLNFVSYALLVILILIGSCFNITNYPRFWYDEGVFSQVASNLARYGHYATTIISGQSFSDFNSGITTGPTVILPAAVSYKLFGISIMSGRVVSMAYLILFLGIFYFFTKKVFGENVALLSFASIFFTRFILIVIKWGRFLMGEVPAMSFLFLGLFFHASAEENDSEHDYLLSGLFYGLSILTKEYVALFLLPALALYLILKKNILKDARKMVLPLLIGILAPELIFYSFKIHFLGWPAFIGNVLERRVFSEELFSPSFLPLASLFKYYQPVLIAVCFMAYRVIKRTDSERFLRLLELIVLFNLFFFLVSGYIARYALFLVLSNILVVHYLFDIGLIKNARDLGRKVRIVFVSLAVLALIMTLVFLGRSGADRSENNDDLISMSGYLEKNVPDGLLIETPEYEVAAISQSNTFHMPPGIMPTKDENKIRRYKKYDFLKINAPFLLEGDFARGLYYLVYPAEKVGKNYGKVKMIGRYTLYKRSR